MTGSVWMLMEWKARVGWNLGAWTDELERNSCWLCAPSGAGNKSRFLGVYRGFWVMVGTRRIWIPSDIRLFLKSEREGFAHFVTHECKQESFFQMCNKRIVYNILLAWDISEPNISLVRIAKRSSNRVNVNTATDSCWASHNYNPSLAER